MMETIDQTRIPPTYREISRESDMVIDINADAEEALWRILLKKKYLICLDFSNEKNVLMGILTYSDIKKACIDRRLKGKVADIMNRNFSYTTMDNLEKDVKKLKYTGFLPVVDEEKNLLFTLDRSSCHAWNDAQDYEIDWWRKYYENVSTSESQTEASAKMPDSLDRLDRMLLPQKQINLIREKYRGGGICIEMGAGPVLGYMLDIPDKNRRIIIEPLCERYAALRAEFGVELYNERGIEYYPQGADIYIPELQDTADVMFLMNMLDHTPDWPFVLGNAASYAKKNCLLHIANDIDHHSESVQGHFNITYNPEKFFKLIEQFGFEMIWKKYWIRSKGSTMVSCLASKK